MAFFDEDKIRWIRRLFIPTVFRPIVGRALELVMYVRYNERIGNEGNEKETIAIQTNSTAVQKAADMKEDGKQRN